MLTQKPAQLTQNFFAGVTKSSQRISAKHHRTQVQVMLFQRSRNHGLGAKKLRRRKRLRSFVPYDYLRVVLRENSFAVPGSQDSSNIAEFIRNLENFLRIFNYLNSFVVFLSDDILPLKFVQNKRKRIRNKQQIKNIFGQVEQLNWQTAQKGTIIGHNRHRKTFAKSFAERTARILVLRERQILLLTYAGNVLY